MSSSASLSVEMMMMIIKITIRDLCLAVKDIFVNTEEIKKVTLTFRFKASLATRTVRNLLRFAVFTNVTVFPSDISVRVLGLDFERPVGSFVPVGIRPVVVLPVDLLQDRHWRRCGAILCIYTGCSRYEQGDL